MYSYISATLSIERCVNSFMYASTTKCLTVVKIGVVCGCVSVVPVVVCVSVLPVEVAIVTAWI